MDRARLLKVVENLLLHSGYRAVSFGGLRSVCFDILARRDSRLLFLKVLMNIDSFSASAAGELKRLARGLKAVPLLIGRSSSNGPLANGTVYERHGVRIVTLKTLHDMMRENVMPCAFAAPGGFYLNIDGDVLREERRRRACSLGEVAESVGVTRKAVQMYEKGMRAAVDVAVRLQDFLSEEVVKPVDPLDYEPPLDEQAAERHRVRPFEQYIFRNLKTLRFSVRPTFRCHIDALAERNEVLVLAGIGGSGLSHKKKGEFITTVSRITERRGVLFLERTGEKTSIEGTPVITRLELRSLSDAGEMLTLIDERQGRPYNDALGKKKSDFVGV